MVDELQIQAKVSSPRGGPGCGHEEGPLLPQATGTEEGSSTVRGAKSYQPHVASTTVLVSVNFENFINKELKNNL